MPLPGWTQSSAQHRLSTELHRPTVCTKAWSAYGLDLFTVLEPHVAVDLPRVATEQPLAVADRQPLVPAEG
jgi:hypothetical protein